MSNMKPDAPTDMDLRGDLATGQAMSSQSVQTPSTIHRDDVLSQFTRDPSSLRLSDTSSLDGSDSKSHYEEPPTTTQTATVGGYEPRASRARGLHL